MILRSSQVKAYQLCVVLHVTTLLYAVKTVQLPRDQRQHAVCSLTLQGHPDPETLGVAAADLHCTSSSPIPIGINATYLGRFARHFTGVQVISNLACQQQAKGYTAVKGARVPLLALLYFCGDYHVTLQQPSVQDVSLMYYDNAWDTAAVAFGAQTEVSIHQGRFTGNSAGSALVAFQNATVSVSDGTVLDFNEGWCGAGLMAIDEGKLALSDSTLHYNHADSGGSVLCAHNASINITSTEFHNNTAVKGGGALAFSSQARAVVVNSTFTKNYAAFGGGLDTREKANLTLRNSSFMRNEAAISGGAVYLDNHSMAVVHGCAYSGNHAQYGGGLYCVGCLLTTISTAFTNNSADNHGGGLYAVNDAHAMLMVTSFNSTWHRNSAVNGAALAMYNTPSPVASRNTFATLNITANSFTNNNATSDGGGLCLQALIEAVVTDSNFSHNYAAYGGGLGAWDRAKMTVQNSYFTRNHAQSGGGGLYCDGCLLSTISTAFTNNSADGYGGGLDAVNAAQVTSVNSTWNSNRAAHGAALAMTNTPSPGASRNTSATLNITANNFTNNNATLGGGGLRLEVLIEAVVVNSTFSQNLAGQNGGGLDTLGKVDLTIQDGFFVQNAATGGGAAYLDKHSQATVHGCTYTGNHAQSGGGLFCDGCLLSTISTAFTNNSADGYGGGLNAINVAHVTSVKSTWHSNTAANGAGLAMTNPPSSGASRGPPAVLSITNSTIINNNATGSGGGFCLRDHVQGNIMGSNFSTNVANSGGAISMRVTANFTAAYTSFSRNTAGSAGGALQINSVTAAVVSSCIFSSNNALWGGGIHFFMDHNSLTLTHSILESNSAINYGGGLTAEGIGKIIVTAVDCTGNRAGGEGGAIAINGMSVDGPKSGSSMALVTITKSYFSTNHAASVGGGLKMYYGVQALVSKNCRFIGNSAAVGGAFALDSHVNLTVKNSTMQDNIAGGAGGALYQQANTSALVTAGSMIQNNTADSGGGSYCTSNAQISVTADSLVVGNRASNGGGFYARGNALVVLNNSMLFRNGAYKTGGGILLIDAAQADLTSCLIIGNAAGSWGGGLAATGQAVVTLVDSEVVNNTASSNGGGIATGGAAQLRLLGNTSVTNNAVDGRVGSGGGVLLASGAFDLGQVMRAVQGNNAAYDSNVQSKVTNITIHGNTSVVGFVNSIGKDEGLLHVSVNFSGYYGLPCQGVLVQAALADGTFLGSNRSDQNGMAYMSFRVARPPGPYTVLFAAPDVSEVPAAKLSLQVRACLCGEVTPIPETCQQCQQGYFSFDPQQAVCEICPANANCTGGDVILPLPGYWRSSANSTQVHRCLNPSACMVSNQAALQSCAANSSCGASSTFKDLQCSPDYVGNLCEVCAAGRGAIKLFVCKPCMANSHIIALYVIAAIIILFFIKLLCYLTLNQSRNVCLGDTSKLPAAELLRPLILYSQYMLIVSSMNIEWPASLSYPLKVLGWVWSSASPETLSIDCILPKNSSLPMSIQKVLFYVCMPVALLLFLMLTELASLAVGRMLLAKRVGRHAVVVDLKDRMLSSTLVAVFFFLPSVLRTLFSMFACTQIDQPAAAPYAPAAVGSFWVFDMNHQCFAGYHRAWALGLGLPLVLVVCLGLPSGVLFLLLSNKSKLREESFMQQYGFLYRSYRDGLAFGSVLYYVRPCYWWQQASSV